ncbi:MAG: alpha/beta fold hydrolase [Alphaproteobacteria bacterium]|jgi:alpha/beta superfamily hydrolase|nr:alpha/beta fold hydrolase [Alphaproteobacteria bacterium]
MPEVIINGPEGRLEARYMPAADPTAPLALILHPEPNRGGNMNNRVSLAMYKNFQDRGFHVMRFNFRGVGRSKGIYNNGEGELSDAATALDWIEAQCPNTRACWVAGFSFGAWIGMQLMMRRPEVQGFVAVTPPATDKDFTFLAPCPSSGVILHGDADTVVPAEAVSRLVDRIQTQRGVKVDLRFINDANHFFTSHLDELMEEMGNYLDDAMPNIGAPAL